MWRKKYHNLLSPLIQFIQYQFLIYGNFHMLIKPQLTQLQRWRKHLLQNIQEFIDYCHHIYTPSFSEYPLYSFYVILCHYSLRQITIYLCTLITSLLLQHYQPVIAFELLNIRNIQFVYYSINLLNLQHHLFICHQLRRSRYSSKIILQISTRFPYSLNPILQSILTYPLLQINQRVNSLLHLRILLISRFTNLPSFYLIDSTAPLKEQLALIIIINILMDYAMLQN
ncbi:unnamed protein product [Paramecium octaurelia]|uniref:Uncharacterized protein n=1 Tax=Paramecium octaurelia TaxID=43137 RepID=A0A8S1WDI9_PAROT|nr:unnamed protein product [Paramecium octaurelia]